MHNYLQHPNAAAAMANANRLGPAPHISASGGHLNKAGSGDAKQAAAEEQQAKIDAASRKGQFGWCEFEKNFIPYIFRWAERRRKQNHLLPHANKGRLDRFYQGYRKRIYIFSSRSSKLSTLI